MRRVLWLGAFAVAMACVESTVVVYLRAAYCPDGFGFPLVPVPRSVFPIETVRETATIVMLLTVAALAARDRFESFLHFCFLFGVWDIFYYAWLLVFLGWPSSLLTWDVLFLIPLPWLGPVLAPVLVAAALVTGSLLLLRVRGLGVPIEPPRWAWALQVVAGLTIIVSFVWDWRAVIEGRVPESFPWGIFATGFGLGVAVFVVVYLRLPRKAMVLAEGHR